MRERIGTVGNLGRKLELPLHYLKDITDNFSPDREIGRGGFGVVYKGIEVQSGVVIAVKKLKPILGVQERQFKNEVNHLARVNHENIVKLIGYCDETKERPVYDDYRQKYVMAEVQEKLLCYEYLSNGSLDNILHDECGRLDWQKRNRIITGICQGLCYLHEGLDNNPIVHMDLKPSNILLDANMVPKIADFGLSRLFSEEQTRTYTMNVIGSIGYMAPEYCHRGEISTKSDIYSLGVLILEIVTGEKNYKSRGNMSGEQFIENVRENWTTMSAIMSKYPSLEYDCLLHIQKCIEIGLSCVETDQERRPSAREISVQMLCGESSYGVDSQFLLHGHLPHLTLNESQISTLPRSNTANSNNSGIDPNRILKRASSTSIIRSSSAKSSNSGIESNRILKTASSSTSTTAILSHVFSFSANRRQIGILAFEVANTIFRGSTLMKTLSKQSMEHLKEVVFSSEAPRNLISEDHSQLLVLVEADIREDLRQFSTEVARFGNQCKEPYWHCLDRYFLRLQSELRPGEASDETVISNIQYLIKLAQRTSELYQEMSALDNLYMTLEDPNASEAILISVKNKKNIVKNLKRKSLWPKKMDEIMDKLVDFVYFLQLEIDAAFPKKQRDQTSNFHQMLGPAGLALQYAKVILHINTLTVAEARAKMDMILQWLVPAAESTRLCYKNGAFGEWEFKGLEGIDESEDQLITASAMLGHENAKVNRIETLYYADKETTEGYVLDLLWALQDYIDGISMA
ncbi:hypothetical protein BS78_05G087600 [Paspalum vaginatum]|nr:hypothetical protein BS78_05G087600 [Paspalum vaginatum]KAJ1274781.1 hypothetical protein BS78_05G087600 [Paspalum vaginatum]